MKNQDNYLKSTKNEVNSKVIDKNSQENFFCEDVVEKGGYRPIEQSFEDLILRNGERPFDWYKDLDLDKSYASKIRRGLIIPPLWLRRKIAKHFKTDSSAIWRINDIEYISLLLKKQGVEDEKGTV